MRQLEERDIKLHRIIDAQTFAYKEGRQTAEEAMDTICSAYEDWCEGI